MVKLTSILFVCCTVLITITTAKNLTDIAERRDLIEQNDNESNATDVGTSRVRHHLLPLYGGSALLGFGGLHALAVLYAIKVKVIIVAVIIALSIYYYSKIYLFKNCHQEVIRETNPYESFSSHGPSGYSNSLPPDFSYSGPDPYSAYANIHPDISSIEHLHHHATGFDDIHPDVSSFDHDHHHHDSVPDSSGAGSEPGVVAAGGSPAGSPATSASTTATEQAKTTRRVYNQMRQMGNPMFDNINWAEIAFQFLGVDSDGCRRRFTCELDFRVKGSPFTRFAFSMVSPKFFDKYRDLTKDAVKPTSFADCARLHRECKEAEKYDTVDEEIEEVTEPAENNLSEESDRQLHEPIGRLILKRAEK